MCVSRTFSPSVAESGRSCEFSPSDALLKNGNHSQEKDENCYPYSAYFYDCEGYYCAVGFGKSSVSRIINQLKNFGEMSPKRKSKFGRKSKTTPRTDKFLVQNITMHSYKTSRDLERKLLVTGVSVNSSTVRRGLGDLQEN
ncbi:hypothetical protein TNCV_410661 [Trichonephila clavipes]|nr:hypothetical protein TNCV_410661 [Trichonephila clavipes]